MFWGRGFVAVEEDVLGRVGHLGRLVVVVDEEVLGRFVGGGDVGREEGAVDDDADDLVLGV